MANEWEKFRSQLRLALDLNISYLDRPEKPPRSLTHRYAKSAAVIAIFGETCGGEVSLLMTRRTEWVESHKGEMAFPGGVCEPGESQESAALRETYEEVGLSGHEIKVVGRLPDLTTGTGYIITPFLAEMTASIEEAKLVLDPQETAEALWIPWSHLTRPGIYRRELYAVGNVTYPIHVFEVDNHRIWGATGALIKNIWDRLGSIR